MWNKDPRKSLIAQFIHMNINISDLFHDENLSVLFIKMELKLSLCWASFWNENTTLVYARCGRTKIQAVDSIKLFIYDNFNLCYLISMFCGLSRKATESKLKLWTASKLRAWKINYHHTNLYYNIQTPFANLPSRHFSHMKLRYIPHNLHRMALRQVKNYSISHVKTDHNSRSGRVCISAQRWARRV